MSSHVYASFRPASSVVKNDRGMQKWTSEKGIKAKLDLKCILMLSAGDGYREHILCHHTVELANHSDSCLRSLKYSIHMWSGRTTLTVALLKWYNYTTNF